MQKEKIGYIITKSNFGGAQKYVFDLAKEMHATGHDVFVVLGGDGMLTEKLHFAGIRVIPLPSLGRKIRALTDIKLIVELARILKQESPTIVHLNSSKIGIMGALAGKIARTPTIVFTAHAWAFNDPSLSTFVRMMAYPLHVLTVFLSTKTIAVSHTLVRQLRFPWIQHKFSVIYNGIDTTPLEERDVARAKIFEYANIREARDDVFLIGTIGELHPVKGHLELIEAFTKIQKGYPSAQVVIFGEGIFRKKLEEKIETENLTSSIHLLGYIENAQTLLSGLDLFVLPSYSEALSYALLEAGSAGCPVVASNVGGIPEVIDHEKNGLLVPSKNPRALVEGMHTLMEDSVKREVFGEMLQITVKARFSKQQMLESTKVLYRKLRNS